MKRIFFICMSLTLIMACNLQTEKKPESNVIRESSSLEKTGIAEIRNEINKELQKDPELEISESEYEELASSGAISSELLNQIKLEIK